MNTGISWPDVTVAWAGVPAIRSPAPLSAGILSPLLANIALSVVDEQFQRRWDSPALAPVSVGTLDHSSASS
jgi:hypothetical protein